VAYRVLEKLKGKEWRILVVRCDAHVWQIVGDTGLRNRVDCRRGLTEPANRLPLVGLRGRNKELLRWLSAYSRDSLMNSSRLRPALRIEILNKPAPSFLVPQCPDRDGSYLYEVVGQYGRFPNFSLVKKQLVPTLQQLLLLY